VVAAIGFLVLNAAGRLVVGVVRLPARDVEALAECTVGPRRRRLVIAFTPCDF
jgi:hypothetical protein